MSDCYCDFDGPSFFSETHPKARKTHKCYECGRRIEAGETYSRVWGIWDGRMDTHGTCRQCCALRDYVKSNVPCFCWAYGSLRDDAMETLREYSSELPGMWFGGARLYVRANKIRRAQRTEL